MAEAAALVGALAGGAEGEAVVGEGVEREEGEADGLSVGACEGELVGETVVGDTVDDTVVGDTVGAEVGGVGMAPQVECVNISNNSCRSTTVCIVLCAPVCASIK